MSIFPKLRHYFASHLRDEFEPRVWDCAKFAIGWAQAVRPALAGEAVKLLVAAGYNEVKAGDAKGLERVYASFGCRTPEQVADMLHERLGAHFERDHWAEPGDIAISAEGLCFGVVDEDYQAVYLNAPSGYTKRALQPGDAFLRIKRD